MTTWSERCAREDEEDRLSVMAALHTARAASERTAMQMQLSEEGEDDSMPYGPLDEGTDFLGTCQSCGAYWDVRNYERCPARRTIDGETFRCDGYIG